MTLRSMIDDMFEAIDERHFDVLTDLFTPDCRYERPGYAPICGADALLHFYRHERVISKGKHLINDFVEDGRRAVATGSFEGVLRDGSSAKVNFADLYVIDDSRIAERRTYFFTPVI